ncbi:hypothetical protein HK107_15205 [Parvularcula sp. ZS-1/3]|uniref:Uncharacterized protein n=1 Tax=Parvularcula mediterranea TaxID=2732508 RepID=A0A7Y3W6L9_9PROT|nr:hypothetical protein [Parvularcula mediterranea]NNU17678.1 hypothetical protein [Parvularcula mediterranea]
MMVQAGDLFIVDRGGDGVEAFAQNDHLIELVTVEDDGATWRTKIKSGPWIGQTAILTSRYRGETPGSCETQPMGTVVYFTVETDNPDHAAAEGPKGYSALRPVKE